jgi:NAD(P)-dependent dehydrogenase (short-subunit alcohol dehydrogenase family)
MAAVSFDFTGEHVLVTGASRGIGEAVAQAFGCAGADVTVLADDNDAHTAADRISQRTRRKVAAVVCDITDPRAVHDAVANMTAIDVLVNNAGIERITPLFEATPATDDDFRRIIDINIVGTYTVTRQVAARMRSGGRIILTSSIWGRVAVPAFSAYCASKHAIIGFTRSIAHELAPRGIRVNAVCPGWVRTVQSMATLRRMAERTGRSEADLLGEISAAQAMPGLMEPGDVADLYLFLASPGAANMTGQAVVVDRGEVMA